MRRPWLVLLSVILVLAFLFSGCTQATSSSTSAPAASKSASPSPSPVTAPKQASLITHNVGGTFYSSSVGVAKVISDNTPIKVVVIPTQGPTTYMPMINSGEVDMGFPHDLDAYAGFTGNADMGYKQKNSNVRILVPGAMIPPGVSPIIVRKDSNIKTIADLKGKRVSGGFAGQRIPWYQIQAHLVLGGLDWKDVIEVPVADYSAGLAALREGRVDAAYGGSYFGAATLELNAAIGIRLLPVEVSNPERVKRFKEILPGWEIVLMQPDMWITEPSYVFTYKTSLIANANFNDETAYTIVKCVYDNYQAIAALGGNTKYWEPKAFFNPEPMVPYHNATIKYYKEKGLWTPAVEKIQNELLASAK